MTDGRRAAILGASEEGGTGWAIAKALASQGGQLTLGARRREGLEKLAGEVAGAAVTADATVEAEVERFVAEAAKDGPLTSAVLVAGAAWSMG